jgi:hypothetical protein
MKSQTLAQLRARDGKTFVTLSQTIGLVEKLVSTNVFELYEIAIQTPYRAQNAIYRTAMTETSLISFWNLESRNIWAIKLMTIDSFQGGEKPCVILYVQLFSDLESMFC